MSFFSCNEFEFSISVMLSSWKELLSASFYSIFWKSLSVIAFISFLNVRRIHQWSQLCLEISLWESSKPSIQCIYLLIGLFFFFFFPWVSFSSLFLKEFVYFILVVNNIGKKLFIIYFWYTFSVGRTCSDILFHLFDNLWLPSHFTPDHFG